MPSSKSRKEKNSNIADTVAFSEEPSNFFAVKHKSMFQKFCAEVRLRRSQSPEPVAKMAVVRRLRTFTDDPRKLIECLPPFFPPRLTNRSSRNDSDKNAQSLNETRCDVDLNISDRSSPEIDAIFLAKFDKLRGNILSFQFPANLDLTGSEFHSLPSGCHSVSNDTIYFRMGSLYGVSAFLRFSLDVNDPNNSKERGARIISVGIVSKSWTGFHFQLERLRMIAERAVLATCDNDTNYFLTLNFAEINNSCKSVSLDELINTVAIHKTHPVNSHRSQAIAKKRIMLYSAPPVEKQVQNIVAIILMLLHPKLACKQNLAINPNPLFYVNLTDIPLMAKLPTYICSTTESIFESKPNLWDVYVSLDLPASTVRFLFPPLSVDKSKSKNSLQRESSFSATTTEKSTTSLGNCDSRSSSMMWKDEYDGWLNSRDKMRYKEIDKLMARNTDNSVAKCIKYFSTLNEKFLKTLVAIESSGDAILRACRIRNLLDMNVKFDLIFLQSVITIYGLKVTIDDRIVGVWQQATDEFDNAIKRLGSVKFANGRQQEEDKGDCEKTAERLLVLVFVGAVIAVAVSASAEDAFAFDENDADIGDDTTSNVNANTNENDLAGFTLRALPAAKIERGLAGIAWSLLRAKDFAGEFVLLAVLTAVIALHFVAKDRYLRKATAWMKASIHVWQLNFSHFGDEKNYSLIRDGPYDFIFYASGRRYLQKVYGFIQLASSLDPIGLIFSNSLMSQLHPTVVKYDTVVMDFHINDDLPNLFFAILAKDQYQNIKRKRYDVADFGSLIKPPSGLSIPFPKDHFVVLTDAPELATTNPEIIETLWASVGIDHTGKGDAYKFPLIESIIITDQAKLAELPATAEELKSYPKMMHVSFRIDEAAPPTVGEKMVQLLMDIVDYYGEARFTADGLNKLKKVRLNAEDRIAKKQAELRKKELKDLKYQAQKKKEEEVAKLSAEEQRKFNERKQKAELKKRTDMCLLV
ncbi:hypothetical protein HK100_006137 [Physocladia obscura]|uniref:Uncharacterized protein n=1 Tax=Physocladia obscura TaxID=109957 RepID=A0AAD5SQV9_9FUNG|nr:hypothetical protein HK100_006137 [Physocladia obscura]